MKVRYLVAGCGLSLATFAASAQQTVPPPDQALIAEWQGKTLQEQHVAERVDALISAYRQQRGELDKLKFDSDAQKATLLEWLKDAQAK